MIKHILTSLIILLCTKVYSQTNQNILEDNQFVIEELPSKMKIKKVNQKKLIWTKEEIYGWYEEGILMPGGESLLKNDIVTKYFTKKDLKFIEEQYTSQKLNWNLYKGKYKVLDSLTIKKLGEQSLRTHKMKYYYHSISTPLFSLDKQFMIIKIYFYCGFMCADQCIYLFQKKHNEKSWTKIDEWQCIAE